MTIKEALTWARCQLEESPSTALDARLLLQHVLRKDPSFIIANPDSSITSDEMHLYKSLIQRRISGEPVSKIIGAREFYGRLFHINEHTLDPRPDSETLVEAVLENVKDKDAHLKILELGVGSGCLILTLLSELPNATGVGVDISPEALSMSQKNADVLDLKTRVQFIESDLFEKVSGPFDIIISNPPYIPTRDIEALEKDVKDFDPLTALDGGETGLDFYKRIAGGYEKYLNKGGLLALEIGQGQAEDVSQILKPHPIQVYKDLSGIERCLVVRR